AHRRTLVLPISRAQILERRFIREAIELAVVARLTGNVSSHPRKILEKQLSLQRAAAEAGDAAAFSALDENFHEMLCHAGGVGFAWRTLASVRMHSIRVCKLSKEDVPKMNNVVDQHAQIVEAVASGDLTLAQSEMRKHLAAFPAKLELAIRDNAGFFTA
ncbi:GntR family transcriptional regulator, partial [Devosia pacifica]